MFNLHLSIMGKALNVSVSTFEDSLGEVKDIKEYMRTFCGRLGLLERRQSANCNMEVTVRKVAATPGITTNLVTGLYYSSMRLYYLIRCFVGWISVEVSNYLDEALEREGHNQQQVVNMAVCAAAEDSRGPPSSVLGAVDKSLGSVNVCAIDQDKLEKPVTSLFCTASCDAYADVCSSCARSAGPSRIASMLSSPVAYDYRDSPSTTFNETFVVL